VPVEDVVGKQDGSEVGDFGVTKEDRKSLENELARRLVGYRCEDW
jgi:hypothetical protein